MNQILLQSHDPEDIDQLENYCVLRLLIWIKNYQCAYKSFLMFLYQQGLYFLELEIIEIIFP